MLAHNSTLLDAICFGLCSKIQFCRFYFFTQGPCFSLSLFSFQFAYKSLQKFCFTWKMQETDVLVMMLSASMTSVINHSVRMEALKYVKTCITVSRTGCWAVCNSKELTFSQQVGEKHGSANMCSLTIWLHGARLELKGNHFCLKWTLTLM